MEKNERFKINKLSMFQKPNPKKGEYRYTKLKKTEKKHAITNSTKLKDGL